MNCLYMLLDIRDISGRRPRRKRYGILNVYSS